MKWRCAILTAALAACSLLASPLATAAEPEIAFTVIDGWVELKLTQDDKPLPAAKVRVIDGRGGKFADGETGPDGTGEFPMPPGTQFRVEVTIGDRVADMILLTQVDGIVVPTSVLLSFGLAPCCRFSSRSAAVASESESTSPESEGDLRIPSWLTGVAGGGLASIGALILVRHERHVRNTSRARK